MSDPVSEPHDFTRLLVAARNGDHDALQQAFVVVFGELRRMASGLLKQERCGHTLQPTALVNEAYLKLCRQDSTAAAERGQFLAVAAQAMRRMLVDHARTRGRDKRRAPGHQVPLDETVAQYESRASDLVALDEALERLSARDARMGRVVELRFFAGLDPVETASALGIGLRTCERDWTMARAWLRQELAG